MSSLLSYKFDNINVLSEDGGNPIQFTNSNVVSGPGTTVLGKLDKAIDLGNSGKAVVSLTGLNPDRERFCIRICFRVTQEITSRNNIVESSLLPFAITLNKGKSSLKYTIYSTVNNADSGWRGPTNRYKSELTVGKWYTITLAYDVDTAAVFIDDSVFGVYAFAKGKLSPAGSNKKLYFGTWVDGARNHFKNGQLAGFQWQDGIPNNLQSIIDDQRGMAEWFITRKYEVVRKKINLGAIDKTIRYVAATGSHIQYFSKGAIMYHDSIGAAFEIHGAIFKCYKGWQNRDSLGYLIVDESDTTKAHGKKSLFSKGGIYYSGATGAVPVIGQIYIDYEGLGESKELGFPKRTAVSISGGKEQVFQNVRMYHKTNEPHAFEVHGAILSRYIAIGGARKWGFPVTNESDVKENTKIIGKSSEFENCTIYWSSSTGAYEVHGHIKKKYVEEYGGPCSDLGFPTSNEFAIPGVSGAGQMNTFQKGSILWYGSYSSIIVALPFKIYIGRLSTKESEGVGRGQNDIYTKILVKENGNKIYDKRRPSSGDWGGNNSKNINYTIPHEFVPNKANKSVWYQLKAWDADGWGNADDYLGGVSESLNAANGWGLHDNHGTHTLKSSKIKSLTISIRPTINPATLTDSQKWWGVVNQSTPTISWQKHAEAFRDVDSEIEWWDVTDWVDKAFYAAVTKKIAAGGNCFGFSLESIYARKLNSIFSLPICKYDNWNGIKKEINIKHCYQAGAGAVYWFLGQFLTGNTHDPKDVFRNTRKAFNRGDNPVLCITQNYDFSGKPHAIVPVAWDDSSIPWRIKICDPNYKSSSCSSTLDSRKELLVNPNSNTFDYLNGKYKGAEWSGGRLHYIPFGVLNHRPRTPVWELILILIAGTIIIVGDDANTDSIVDENGNDLSAFSDGATAQLKNNEAPESFFYGLKGFDTDAQTGPGNFLIRKDFEAISTTGTGTGAATRLPVGSILRGHRLGSAARTLRNSTRVTSVLRNRTSHFIAADTTIMTTLPTDLRDVIESAVNTNASRNFIHKVKAKKNGKFDYLFKHQFTEVKIDSEMNKNEVIDISMRDVGTSKHTLKLDSLKSKMTNITIINKLGLKGDYIKLTLEKVPLAKAKGIEISLKPGLGDLELIAPAQIQNINIKMEAKVDGKPLIRKFNLPAVGGTRLRLASLLEENTLRYINIDRLFGKALNVGSIKGIS